MLRFPTKDLLIPLEANACLYTRVNSTVALWKGISSSFFFFFLLSLRLEKRQGTAESEHAKKLRFRDGKLEISLSDRLGRSRNRNPRNVVSLSDGINVNNIRFSHPKSFCGFRLNKSLDETNSSWSISISDAGSRRLLFTFSDNSNLKKTIEN